MLRLLLSKGQGRKDFIVIFDGLPLQMLCDCSCGHWRGLAAHRPERERALPLHPGHHQLPGAPCLCCLRTRRTLEKV